jgi:acetyl-CoA carboxylase biotin carboxyl carrier protein
MLEKPFPADFRNSNIVQDNNKIVLIQVFYKNILPGGKNRIFTLSWQRRTNLSNFIYTDFPQYRPLSHVFLPYFRLFCITEFLFNYRKLFTNRPSADIIIRFKRPLLLRGCEKMPEKDTDLAKIQELIGIMKEHDLVEVEIKHGDDKILLKRAQLPAVTAVPVIGHGLPLVLPPTGAAPTAPMASGQPAQQDNLIEIKSPIVGTFYATPSPDSEPYVEIGSKVEAQTVVCIIEAMKVMNEIKAETSGTIVQILATSGQAVEYGQVLFKVKPD